MIGGAIWSKIPAAWAKFLLILIPILAVSTALFAAVFFVSKRAELRNELEAKVATIADINAAALAGSLWSFDAKSTRNIITAISVNREILCIEVTDHLDMVQHRWPETGCGYGPPLPVVVRNIEIDHRRIGHITLVYNYDPVNAALTEEIFHALGLLLLLLVVTVITALTAHRLTIGVPLARLIHSIRAAEQKGSRELVEWQANDELGNVIAAYNRLLVKLAYEEVALRKSEERLSADITERKQAENDLAQERAILQATLENVDQGIVMFDQGLRLVTFNRRAAELLSVPLKLLTQRPTFAEIIAAQIERGEFGDVNSPERIGHAWDRLPTEYSTLKHRRPDGTVIEITSNPLFMGGFVCTYTDITAETRAVEETLAAMQATERAYAELKETQASLVQAEKMASLAMLVAGVAHEINTPVGIAYGCASHLANRTRQLVSAVENGNLKKSELLAYAAAAAESTRLMSGNLSRAAELIRSFKHVAVDQASAELRRFDLKIYIEEVITSLGPRLRTTPHRVIVECAPDISVNSHPGALSQVLTNLVMNALIHAFDDAGQGGTIAITVAAPVGGNIDLKLSDNGKGIPDHLRDKVFEPFFTTRRGSGGSGLGLHIVFNLVTQTLGGRIDVDSVEGMGTTFHIRFPREAPCQPEALVNAGTDTGTGSVVRNEEAHS